MNQKLILINGDSYTAKDDVLTSLSYSDTVCDYFLEYDVKNIALSGSSNSRIFKSSIEHLLRYKRQYKEIIFVVGYSFIHSRLEVASQHDKFNNQERKYYNNDYGFKLNWNKDVNKYEDEMYPKFTTSLFIDGMNEKLLRIPELLDPNLLLSSFYNELYMFVNTLENLNIKYFVFSAANNTLMPGEKTDFLNRLEVKKYLDNNTNVILDSSMKLFGEEFDMDLTDTHHIQHKHDFEKFGNYIIEKIKKL